MFESGDGRLNCHPMYSVGSVKAIRSVFSKATVRQQKKKKKKGEKKKDLSFETQERVILFVADFQPAKKKRKKKKSRESAVI